MKPVPRRLSSLFIPNGDCSTKPLLGLGVCLIHHQGAEIQTGGGDSYLIVHFFGEKETMTHGPLGFFQLSRNQVPPQDPVTPRQPDLVTQIIRKFLDQLLRQINCTGAVLPRSRLRGAIPS